MKNLVRTVAVVATLLFSSQVLHASEAPMVTAFVREDCVHCQDAKAFFAVHPEITVAYRDLDVTEERDVFKQLARMQEIAQVTPVILVSDSILVGFDSADTTGEHIISLLEHNSYAPHVAISYFLEQKREQRTGAVCEEDATECIVEPALPSITVPFLGTIDPQTYSLFSISSILGLIDGFNPCAMAVLVIFLTLLTQAGSRRRMFGVAGLFLLAEAIMYFLILTVWGTLWDFIGLQRLIGPLLGLLAIGSGSYFLYRYYNARNVCETMSPEEEGRLLGKMRDISTKPLTIATIVAIIGIAFSVNIIEFACSIGIPQTFTYILQINELSFITRHLYIFLYIIWYMIDDLIVFALAIWAFEKLSQTQNYVRYSNLIGGLLMLILGLMLAFAPQMLVF
ncbi:MAG: glutaredoxin family protein [bacterium]|nr:glutaredoxin family protein [bacterium]